MQLLLHRQWHLEYMVFVNWHWDPHCPTAMYVYWLLLTPQTLPYIEPLLNKVKLIQTKKLNMYCEIKLQGHMYLISVFQILRMALVVSHLLMCYMQRRMRCSSYVLCANKWMALLVVSYLQATEVCVTLPFTNTELSDIAWRLHWVFCLMAFKCWVVNAVCCVFSGSCTWCRS